jgi:hypothetical protein
MSYKGDIQATRFTAATSTVIIAPPVRLRGIIIASSSSTTVGVVQLKTTSATGTTLFTADVPAGDVINFSFPEDAAVTLLTDKYSGPGLTSD